MHCFTVSKTFSLHPLASSNKNRLTMLSPHVLLRKQNFREVIRLTLRQKKIVVKICEEFSWMEGDPVMVMRYRVASKKLLSSFFLQWVIFYYWVARDWRVKKKVVGFMIRKKIGENFIRLEKYSEKALVTKFWFIFSV